MCVCVWARAHTHTHIGLYNYNNRNYRSVILRCFPYQGTDCWGSALWAGRLQILFSMVLLEYFTDIILPAGLGSAYGSNTNEYRKYFLECKGGRCVRLTTLPISCADCLDIWETQIAGNLLACRRPWRIAWPLPQIKIFQLNSETTQFRTHFHF